MPGENKNSGGAASGDQSQWAVINTLIFTFLIIYSHPNLPAGILRYLNEFRQAPLQRTREIAQRVQAMGSNIMPSLHPFLELNFAIMMFTLPFASPKRDSNSEDILLKITAAVAFLIVLIPLLVRTRVVIAPAVRNALQWLRGSQPNPNEDVVANAFFDRFLANLNLGAQVTGHSISTQLILRDCKQSIIDGLKRNVLSKSNEERERFYRGLQAFFDEYRDPATHQTKPRFTIANINLFILYLLEASLEVSHEVLPKETLDALFDNTLSLLNTGEHPDQNTGEFIDQLLQNINQHVATADATGAPTATAANQEQAPAPCYNYPSGSVSQQLLRNWHPDLFGQRCDAPQQPLAQNPANPPGTHLENQGSSTASSTSNDRL